MHVTIVSPNGSRQRVPLEDALRRLDFLWDWTPGLPEDRRLRVQNDLKLNRRVSVELPKDDPLHFLPMTTMYTTAPVDYDGFGTQTWFDAGTDNGRPTRCVEVEIQHEEWQRGRYFSGCYSAYDERNWLSLVKCGLAIATGTPPALGGS